MSDIIIEDGDYRARIELDPYPTEPVDDFAGTTYQMDCVGWGARVELLGTSWKAGNPDLGDVIRDTWTATRDMDSVEAVLRGKANVCEECEAFLTYVNGEQAADTLCPYAEPEHGNDQGWHSERYDFRTNPVVGFDYIDRDYGKIINVVTLADLKAWGFESVEAYREETGHSDPSHGNLDEWEAWADGDVYFVVIEQRVQTYTQIADIGGTLIREVFEEGWEKLDSCGGFYGDEYAEEFARDTLGYYVNPVKAGESA